MRVELHNTKPVNVRTNISIATHMLMWLRDYKWKSEACRVLICQVVDVICSFRAEEFQQPLRDDMGILLNKHFPI